MTYINVLYTENSITLCYIYIYVQKKQVLMPYFVRLANNFYAWNHEFILKQILVIISFICIIIDASVKSVTNKRIKIQGEYSLYRN